MAKWIYDSNSNSKPVNMDNITTFSPIIDGPDCTIRFIASNGEKIKWTFIDMEVAQDTYQDILLYLEPSDIANQ